MSSGLGSGGAAGDETGSRGARQPLREALLHAVPAALQAYGALRLGQQASAIAYRMLVSIAPLAVVLVAILGLVLRNETVQAELIDWIVDVLPFDESGSQQVESAILAIASPASLLGFVGLVAFMWTATGLMSAIRFGLETAMVVRERRPMIRGKAFDALLVLCSGALVLVMAAVSAVGDLFLRWLGDVADRFGVDLPLVGWNGGRVLQLLVVAVVVWLLYRFVPDRRLPNRDLAAGAIATSLLLFGISLFSSLLFSGASELSVVYGSLAAVLTFLYAVYLSACALLIGAAFASALGDPPGP
ncbi:MAG: YihY/virulence factor BrkB family protein, partial [Gaiella sp.]